jgi:hypothetical protein
MKPNVSDLIPPARDLYYRFEEDMKTANVLWKATCIKRTRAEQVALYAQGRETLAVINELRRVAGLMPIDDAEAKRKVTWTKNSRHLPIEKGTPLAEKHPDWVGLCYAWDIVIMNGKTPTWILKVDVDGDNIPDYEEAAKVGENLGLIVGARWSNPDYPHYEFDLKTL